MGNKKIAIIAAMDEELELLLAEIENRKDFKFNNHEYHTGKLQGVDVIMTKSGIGKVNAAATTAILIHEFSPNLIINTGSAGGLRNDLQIGDVVISKRVAHHDVDVTAFGYEVGQVPDLPTYFAAKDKVVSKILRLNSDIKLGTMLSGDKFLQDGEVFKKLLELFPDAISIDMEAAAIAQVAHMNNTCFVVIRAISDLVFSKDNHVDFDEFLATAAKNSSQMVTQLVESFK